MEAVCWSTAFRRKGPAKAGTPTGMKAVCWSTAFRRKGPAKAGTPTGFGSSMLEYRL